MKTLIKNNTPELIKKWFHLLQALYASVSNGLPSRKLKLIGVTGTSGKSTTTFMIYHILKESGVKVGLISTVGVIAGDEKLDTGFHVTTPDPVDFQKYLKFMVSNGVEYVVVECSSHALAQGRLGFLKLDHAIITNIKSDHLDWHRTWENYALAKSSIAKKIKKGGKLILNRDDKKMYQFVTDYVKNNTNTEIISYSYNELQGIGESKDGLAFTLSGQNFFMPILGAYNIENALAAINIAHLLDITFSQSAKALAEFKSLVGRMQIMQKEPFLVIVDFAHNTDSLVKSLTSVRKLVSQNGNLICVFGSAGLRDVEKRYTMGEQSAKLADITVITAEDPRIEKLADINYQIIQGTKLGEANLVERFNNTEEYKLFMQKLAKGEEKINKKTVFVFDEESINSRYDAIEFAIRIAKPGDVVITEGKGHEESLCFGTTEYPFTDQEAVERALERTKEEVLSNK